MKSFFVDSDGKIQTQKVIWTSVIVVIALWTVSAATIAILFDDWGERGTFGDMFGCINALFSGLAFSGLIVTLIFQHEDLKNQRQDLKDQRIEFQTQNETLKLQRFENTFFNMLSLHHEIVSGMSLSYPFRGGIDRACGREVFSAIYRNIDINLAGGLSYSGLKDFLNDQSQLDPDVNIVARYDSTREARLLDHYFTNFCQTLEYIDESPLISGEERVLYSKVLRSQLSDDELNVMFYFCLSSRGASLKKLVEKYSIFANLQVFNLASRRHEKLYHGNAFIKS